MVNSSHLNFKQSSTLNHYAGMGLETGMAWENNFVMIFSIALDFAVVSDFSSKAMVFLEVSREVCSWRKHRLNRHSGSTLLATLFGAAIVVSATF